MSDDFAYTYSRSDFEQLIAVDRTVDMDALREAARHGVPSSIRSDVWMILLGIVLPDKGEEVTLANKRKLEFDRAKEAVLAVSLIQRIRRELRSTSSDPRAEVVLSVYASHNQSGEFREEMVSLLVPLCSVLKDGVAQIEDLYRGFSQTMELVDYMFLRGLENVMARFIMLFRTFQPRLCGHLEDEGVPLNEWAVSWMRNLLTKELHLDNVLRLWDTYLAASVGIEFHMYVCLAILENCKESLVEMDYSEIRYYLQKLPLFDMDMILMQAYNIQEEANLLN